MGLTIIQYLTEVEQIEDSDDHFSGLVLPESPVNSEFEFEMESFGDTHEIRRWQSSDDSESDEGEEVWVESDENSSEECP